MTHQVVETMLGDGTDPSLALDAQQMTARGVRRRWHALGVLAATSVTTIVVVMVAVLALPTSGVPAAAAVTTLALVPAALVDLRSARLPDALVAVAAAALVVSITAEWAMGTELVAARVGVGVATLAGPLFAMHLVSPAAMGFGDVKAAAVLGAGLGLAGPLVALGALTAACLVGAVAGLATKRRTIPFGPCLIAGAAVSLTAASRGVFG